MKEGSKAFLRSKLLLAVARYERAERRLNSHKQFLKEWELRDDYDEWFWSDLSLVRS